MNFATGKIVINKFTIKLTSAASSALSMAEFAICSRARILKSLEKLQQSSKIKWTPYFSKKLIYLIRHSNTLRMLLDVRYHENLVNFIKSS